MYVCMYVCMILTLRYVCWETQRVMLQSDFPIDILPYFCFRYTSALQYFIRYWFLLKYFVSTCRSFRQRYFLLVTACHRCSEHASLEWRQTGTVQCSVRKSVQCTPYTTLCLTRTTVKLNSGPCEGMPTSNTGQWHGLLFRAINDCLLTCLKVWWAS